MQKQKLLSVLSLAMIATLLLATGRNLVTASPNAQATQAATMAGTTGVTTEITGTGKITGPAEGEAKALALTRVLWWATHDGQKFNADLGYAPLPLDVINKDEAQIAKVTINGKPALPDGIMTSKS
jgi:hypothetical protein